MTKPGKRSLVCLCHTPPSSSCMVSIHSRFQRISLRMSGVPLPVDRKSTRLNSSHLGISYAVFCLKKLYFEPSPPPSQPQPLSSPPSGSPALRRTSAIPTPSRWSPPPTFLLSTAPPPPSHPSPTQWQFV